MGSIKRIGPSRLSPTRSRSVIHDGLVTTVATSVGKVLSLYDQSREALSTIDRNLQEAGTDKSRILMVMAIYHGHRQEARVQPRMGEWVDRANLPLRACVGASLEHDDLIELVVTAARGPEC